jgi:hypothetical protein
MIVPGSRRKRVYIDRWIKENDNGYVLGENKFVLQLP